ncbi:hypothetical protein KEM54_000207, partial [Ascosphaera aggregata]
MTPSNLGLALNPGYLAEQNVLVPHSDRVRNFVPTAVGLDSNISHATIGADGQTKQSENVSQPSSIISSPRVNLAQKYSCASSLAVQPTVVEVGYEAHASKRRKIGDSLARSEASSSSPIGTALSLEVLNDNGNNSTSSPLNSPLSTSQDDRESSVASLFGNQVAALVMTPQGEVEKNNIESDVTHQSLREQPHASSAVTPSEPIVAAAPQTRLSFVKMIEQSVSNHYVSPYHANSEQEISPEVEKAWQEFTKPELISHIERYRSMLRDITRKCDKYERERQIWNSRNTDCEKTIPQILAENKRLRKSAIEWRKTNCSQDQTIAALQRMVRQLQQQAAMLHQDNILLAGQVSILNQNALKPLDPVPAQQQSQSSETRSTQASPISNNAIAVTASAGVLPPAAVLVVSHDAQESEAAAFSAASSSSCSVDSSAERPLEIINLASNAAIAAEISGSTTADDAPLKDANEHTEAPPTSLELPCQPQVEVRSTQSTHPDTTESVPPVSAAEHDKD